MHNFPAAMQWKAPPQVKAPPPALARGYSRAADFFSTVTMRHRYRSHTRHHRRSAVGVCTRLGPVGSIRLNQPILLDQLTRLDQPQTQRPPEMPLWHSAHMGRSPAAQIEVSPCMTLGHHHPGFDQLGPVSTIRLNQPIRLNQLARLDQPQERHSESVPMRHLHLSPCMNLLHHHHP